MNRRRLTVVLAAGVLALFPQAPAIGAPSATSADVQTVVAAAERAHGAGADWRAETLTRLRRLPQWSQTRIVDGPLAGKVVAGKLRLPARTQITGDTTLVADTVEFSGEKPAIVTHGYALTVLPVTAVRTVVPNAVIVMNTSGADGAGGDSGRDGPGGSDGGAGTAGMPAPCFGATDGGPGGSGGPGFQGLGGANGAVGANAGPITVDVPAGSTNSYQLIANGGRGGDGGAGGKGGAITFTTPAGYDPALISAQAFGGGGGSAGSGGAAGAGGTAGAAGKGGHNQDSYCPYYCDGTDGWEGEPGFAGQPGVMGFAGAGGSPGTINGTPAGGGGPGGGGPSGPVTPNPGRYAITAVHSNKCLDVAPGYGPQAEVVGAHVIQSDTICSDGSRPWELDRISGTTDVYRVRFASSSKCLDVNGAAQNDGATVDQWTCVAGAANEQWRLTNTGVADTYTFKAVHSGKCLDVAGASQAVGATVQQWTCNGGANQQWRLRSSAVCAYAWIATKILAPEDSWTGCYRNLVMQSDGNLVIYTKSGVALWATNTGGNPGAYAAFQTDGNFVVYSASGVPLWWTNTFVSGGIFSFQADGNLTIYRSGYTALVWSTNLPPP